MYQVVVERAAEKDLKRLSTEIRLRVATILRAGDLRLALILSLCKNSGFPKKQPGFSAFWTMRMWGNRSEQRPLRLLRFSFWFASVMVPKVLSYSAGAEIRQKGGMAGDADGDIPLE